jgi:hypothetical protein
VRLGDPVPGGTATLTQLADAIKNATKTELSVSMPGTVVTWSPPVPAGPESKPALVSVQPGFKYARTINRPEDLNPGEILDPSSSRTLLAVGALPVIPNVPVLYPGLPGMQIRGPVAPGSDGLLICCDKSIDDWIQTGGPVDATLVGRHKMIDAVFLPGLRSGVAAVAVDPNTFFIGAEDQTAGLAVDALTQALTLSTVGPTVTIEAKANVLLGAAAALGVARLTDTTAAAVTMATWIAQVQVVAAGAAVLLGLPVPVPPTDFGVIASASAKVLAE